jgi:phenylalanyl-tRNA synthetase alpha chain
MTNEEIPNLTAFDEAALDKAFGALERQAREAAAALNGEAAVEAFRLKWLGRKQGRLNEVSGRWLKAAPAEAKKALGVRFNALKAVVEGLLDEAAGAGPNDAALAAEAIDITLPGTRQLTGAEHPITRTLNEITHGIRKTRWWLPGRSGARNATGCCCARTLRRCRCGPWRCSRRRCAS